MRIRLVRPPFINFFFSAASVMFVEWQLVDFAYATTCIHRLGQGNRAFGGKIMQRKKKEWNENHSCDGAIVLNMYFKTENSNSGVFVH